MALFPEIVTRNLSLKLAALGLAILLWSVVRADAPARITFGEVPVDVIVDDPGWILAEPPRPGTVSVIVAGTYRELGRIAAEPMRLVVPVENIEDSTRTQALDRAMVRIGGRVDEGRVVEVQPASVVLQFERVENALKPLAIRVHGELPPGARLTGPITTDPSMVRVSGSRRTLERLDSVPLQPIDLTRLTAAETLQVPVDTGAAGGVLVAPRHVTVIVPALTLPDSVLNGDSVPADTARSDTSAAPQRNDAKPDR